MGCEDLGRVRLILVRRQEAIMLFHMAKGYHLLGL